MGNSSQPAGNSAFLRNAWYAGGFAEEAMIDAQAKAIDHAEIISLKPALLLIDKAAVLARLKLHKLIADEVPDNAAKASDKTSAMAEGAV